MIRYLTELSLEAFTEAARNVPYQQIDSDLFPGIDLWVRRDDLIDPLISGNKAYKLIYNLLEAREQGKDTIVTCGGAWSNHIHASAVAGQRFGFKTIGIIRGERPPVLSAMLQDAERFGMELRFVSRSLYRQRDKPEFLMQAGLADMDYWYIPEGGANLEGVKGVQMLAKVIRDTSPVAFHECWLPCGTGLTLGALTCGSLRSVELRGVAVLKGEAAIQQAATGWSQKSSKEFGSVQVLAGGHCGGYARVDQALIEFISSCQEQISVPLDWVYVAKAALKLKKSVDSRNKIPLQAQEQINVLLLHTGGLQGNRGRMVAF
ncbi:1-aminocyclopropane-1-carboxylate deaminase/D-cysteine desulfhydrase [Microbulbifer mangrovi]|uniref:1-aminocyclopropane-1-carboxylate deaminase/D-cysteine desulfhydrase n=1 Tax=Microbulbifer mangrovi TaxID=927787 RepID=UPI00099061A2|nr:pyridoxal-phosphate dependent enzyme [Microbulbifer mangrovi]